MSGFQTDGCRTEIGEDGVVQLDNLGRGYIVSITSNRDSPSPSSSRSTSTCVHSLPKKRAAVERTAEWKPPMPEGVAKSSLENFGATMPKRAMMMRVS